MFCGRETLRRGGILERKGDVLWKSTAREGGALEGKVTVCDRETARRGGAAPRQRPPRASPARPPPSRRRVCHFTDTPPSSSLLKHLLNGEAGAAAEWQQQNGRTLAGGLACQHLTAAVHSRSRWTVHASSHHLKPALHRHFDCAGVWVRPGCDLPPRTGRVSTLLLKALSQQWSHPAQRTL